MSQHRKELGVALLALPLTANLAVGCGDGGAEGQPDARDASTDAAGGADARGTGGAPAGTGGGGAGGGAGGAGGGSGGGGGGATMGETGRLDFLPPTEGMVEISGTITFGAEVPAGAQVRFAIEEGLPPGLGFDFASLQAGAPVTKPIRRATFTIHRLFPAKFSIAAFVDLNDDGKVNAGDLAGYYGGTAEAPALSFDKLKLVDAKANVSGADFGIGLLK